MKNISWYLLENFYLLIKSYIYFCVFVGQHLYEVRVFSFFSKIKYIYFSFIYLQSPKPKVGGEKL